MQRGSRESFVRPKESSCVGSRESFVRPKESSRAGSRESFVRPKESSLRPAQLKAVHRPERGAALLQPAHLGVYAVRAHRIQREMKIAQHRSGEAVVRMAA